LFGCAAAAADAEEKKKEEDGESGYAWCLRG
jgi:hypothetical protein